MSFHNVAENPLAVDSVGIVDGRTTPEPYVQSDRDKRLAGRLRDLYSDSLMSSQGYRESLQLYLTYLRGEPFATLPETGEVIRLQADAARRLRSFNNILRPSWRSCVGKLTRNIPKIRAASPTFDHDDRRGAKVVDAALRYQARRLDLDLKYQEMCEYLPWAGNSFAYLQWDPQSGPAKAWCEECDALHEPDMEGQPCPECSFMAQAQQFELQMEQEQTLGPGQFDPELSEPIEGPPLELIHLGDLELCVDDPGDWFFPRGAEHIDDCPWIMRAQSHPVVDLRNRFPRFAAFLGEDYTQDAEHHDRRGMSFNSDYGFESNDEWPDDHAWLYTVHEKPTEKYPYGRRIYMVNDLIVDEKPGLYWMLGRYPLFHFGWDKNHGSIYFEPPMAQAWHRQKELNNLETNFRENAELMLNNKWMVMTMSGITDDQITATTGQILRVNPLATAGGDPVKPFPHQAIPPDLYNRRNLVIEDIRYQFGLTEADAGQMGTDPNGRAAAIMAAEADAQIRPITRRNNKEWRDLFLCMAKLMQQFYTGDRTIEVVGPGGYEKYYWEEMQLDHIDVELEEHDGLSHNPEIRRQGAMELMSMGRFNDPMTGLPDWKAFDRMAGLHSSQDGHEIEAKERAAAASIPKKVERGELVIPRGFDDAKIFVEELGAWLRDEGRRRYEEDPQDAVTAEVEAIWMWLMMKLQVQHGLMAPGSAGEFPGNQLAAQGGPNPGQAGPAPGTASQGGQGVGGVGGEANARVQQADQQAEQAARGKAGQENQLS